jgi:RimJ/RimL family protein N-acetyltransferase
MEALHSQRIILRTIRNDDKQKIFEYRSDPEISRFQKWQPKTLSEIDEFLSKIKTEPDIPGTWLQFAIVTKEDNTLIGDCGIHFLSDDPEQVEIGITLNKACQGKGFAGEALALIFDYVFHGLHKHRITASIDPENKPSLRLAERMKMRKEAHFRKSIKINERWVDDIVYAILREEWIKKKRLNPAMHGIRLWLWRLRWHPSAKGTTE